MVVIERMFLVAGRKYREIFQMWIEYARYKLEKTVNEMDVPDPVTTFYTKLVELCESDSGLIIFCWCVCFTLYIYIYIYIYKSI